MHISSSEAQAEERLQASEERFRLLIEHGLEVIAILDVASTIRYVSASVARVLGYQADFLLGRNALEYIHPDDRPAVQQAFEKILPLPGSTTSVQFRVQHRDGTWRHAEGSSTNCLHIEGLRGIVTTLRDITGQKVFEEQLQSSRQQLRQLSSHVESAREEERVRIAREVHDELGQILTALKFDLESMALHHRDRSPAIRNMVRTVDLAMNTVRRISAELRPSILNHFGLSTALNWQVQEFQSRTGIRCRCRVPDHDPPLTGEQSIALFRAFQEILTNVVRHAKARNVSVLLRNKTGWLTLQVTDDGQGIDPKHLSDPHSLGLTGIRERALLLGGHVDFTPRRGGGTVVTIHIPAGRSRSTAPVAPSAGRPQKPLASSLRILLVGDPGAFCSGIEPLLLQACPGAVFRQYCNGDTGPGDKWDLVVIDLSESSSNLDALDRIHDLSDNPPILAFTAHNEPAYSVWARQAGAAASIDKSCSAAQVRGTIENIFLSRRSPTTHRSA